MAKQLAGERSNHQADHLLFARRPERHLAGVEHLMISRARSRRRPRARTLLRLSLDPRDLPPAS